jgi:N-acetylmuramoyl-L-alanine amidase
VSRNNGIIFVALIFLTGCYTPPNNEPVPQVWSASGTHSNSLNAQKFQPIVSQAKTSPPAFSRSNRPVAIIAKPGSVVTWTSLTRWAAEHKLAAPRFISNQPVTTYAMRSTNGVLVLAIGSRDATWNGLEIQLGFEPQIIDDQVFVHGLDLQNNFTPLLCEPPLVFATNRVIVIDPGHGGANVGTHSVLDGRFEKEFTLDWALRLAPLLAANGWQVFLTRTNDADMALSNRVSFAEARHADLFMSLHFNSAAPDTRQAGLETYCLTPTGMPSSLTRGYDDIWSQHYPNNDYDAQNLQLAIRLQGALLHATGEEDRGVRRARFLGVLRGQKRPAILIEGGYLSNPREAKRIEDPAFRQKLAEAVAEALRQNAGIEAHPPEIKTSPAVTAPVVEPDNTNEP